MPPSATRDTLPAWAADLSEKYYSGVTSMFVLHGNVRDLAGRQFVPLQQFLREALFGARDLVLFYDRGGGLTFSTPEMKADFERALSGYDSFHGTNFARGLPRNPDGVLNILDNYLRLRILDGKKIAVVIDFAETVAPAGDTSGMPAEDRNSLVILKRWAQNPVFLQADVTFCLIAENLVDLNLGLVQNPGVAPIQIQLPDEDDRLELIQAQLKTQTLPPGSDVSAATLAHLTAGLKRVQLQSLISYAVFCLKKKTMKLLVNRKKDMIET